MVLKAHGSHLETSARSFEVISDAAAGYGAPAGVIGIVYGTEAGRVLVADPHIRAVGFTGSLNAGQALIDIISHREEPIPFYGELSSLNPLVITPAAAAARADGIAEGLFGSYTLGVGQFCTKPGVAFIPVGATGTGSSPDSSNARLLRIRRCCSMRGSPRRSARSATS